MPEPALTQIGGRYQLIDVIGRGGMGIVYRGFDVAMSRQVAIKMLLGFDAEDKETVLARFHREVTSLAALQHKNIVTIYTFEQYEGNPYMVMEFLEGKGLEKLISTHVPMELTDKLSLILQVCDGLQYAHENGIIHRDIKPANILVLKNGTAKLIDFGIARAGLSETITQPGQVIGSLSYMSPEQISNHALDARTDVFSAGVVLYQLLTGELPFEGADMTGTISNILHAPSPPLKTYLKDYPKELDQIVERALAKKVDERYQSAEDFGYEISRVLDALKRGLVDEYIRRTRVLIERQDWDAARQQLQEVRKIDRRNDLANELFQTVTRELQRQQKAAQVAQLRSQAQLALSQAQYEEALEYLEQGLRLEEGDAELLAIRELVKQGAKRAQDLDDALRRSQAAFYAGDLAEAQSAIEQALAIEPEHTEARTLGHLIKREVAERSKRVQLQGLMDAARAEIGKKNFVEALQFIQQAKEIDPSEPGIQELITWASRGHAQEKTRKELEKSGNQIGRLLREDRYQEALAECDAALERFPEEVSLLKLRELAKRQHEVESRRRSIDEIGNRAREHAEAGDHDKAIQLLESALQTFPGDSSLATLLAITCAEMEHRQRENVERDALIKRDQVEHAPPDAPIQEPPEVPRLLRSLRSGLTEKAPISSLHEIAEQLASINKKQLMGSPSSAEFGMLLAEVEVRQTKFNQDLSELAALQSAISQCNVAAEIARIVDRSKLLNDHYPREGTFAAGHEAILRLAHASKQKRETAANEASRMVREMQAKQEIPELQSMEKRVEEASKNWPDDAYLRSLLDQASARVEEVTSHKRHVLEELMQIDGSLATARSAGQLRLLEEQARVVGSDLIDDAEIANAIGRMSLIVDGKVQVIERICSTLREFATKIANAQTLGDAEDFVRQAKRVASDGMNFEEVDELLRKVQRPIDERKKDYTRIERNLNLLIESATKATGLAELDLILARRRDLLKKYSAEVCFQRVQERLEVSVSERRSYLADIAASEQQAESLLRASEEEEADEPAFAPIAVQSPVSQAPQLQVEAVQAPQAQRRRRLLLPLLSAGGLLGIAILTLAFFPKNVSFQVDPSTADITVDGRKCSSPCQMRLIPGGHEVVASQQGFETIDRIVHVPWGGGALAPLTMKRIPAPNIPPSVAVADSGTLLGGDAKIIVKASLPAVLVFVDGRQVGETGRDGNWQMETTAGPHKLRVEKSGFQQVDPVLIQLDKGKAATVVFSLIQVPSVEAARNGNSGNPAQVQPPIAPTTPATSGPITPQPPPDTFLVLTAPAGAQVHIDQQSSGESTGGPYRIKVGPGQHTVEVFLSGYQPWKQIVSVDLGKEVDIAANLTAIPLVATQPTTPPASAISDDDRKQIQALLNRYADGYNQRNVKLIQAVWQSIPQEKLKEIKDFLSNTKSVKMKLTIIDAIPAGKRVTVDCTQTLQFDQYGKPQSITSQISLYVVKSSSGWAIDFVPNS